MTKQPSNSLQVGTATTTELFKDIDFSGLNAVIDNIATYSHELQETEKELANDIIDEWQKSVIARLQERGNEMRRFLQFFEINECSDPLFIEIGEELAVKTGTESLFKNVMDAIKTYKATQSSKPEKPITDLETTLDTELTSTSSYKLETKKHEINLEKDRQLLRKAERKWKNELTEHDEVKALIQKATQYQRKLTTFRFDCEDKGQLAKLNVSISNQDVRNSLKELIEFGARSI